MMLQWLKDAGAFALAFALQVGFAFVIAFAWLVVDRLRGEESKDYYFALAVACVALGRTINLRRTPEAHP